MQRQDAVATGEAGMGNSGSAPSAHSGRRFAATRWSLVAAASGREPGAAQRALLELCLRYWYPVYAYLRGCGHPPAIAQDIARAFFEHVVGGRLAVAEARAGGRFREYLLERLHRFLATDWRQAVEGATVPEFAGSATVQELESRYQRESSPVLTPEQSYQRSYALEVLAIALARLRSEALQAGRLAMFEAMQPWLSAEPAPGEYEALARALGMPPLAAVVALRRLRQRFRELAESELVESVSSAEDLDTERRALAQALERG